MSPFWFVAGMIIGAGIGAGMMALLAAHGRREKRMEVQVRAE